MATTDDLHDSLEQTQPDMPTFADATSDGDAAARQAPVVIGNVTADAELGARRAVTRETWARARTFAMQTAAVLWKSTSTLSRHASRSARSAFSAGVQRVQREIVTSYTEAGLILALVLAAIAMTIAVLELLMPSWRAALLTSAIGGLIGVALLQKPLIAGELSTAWARARSIRLVSQRRELARVRTAHRG